MFNGGVDKILYMQDTMVTAKCAVVCGVSTRR